MKTFARKIYMFNNFLRLAEIKAVLEGRGFRPNFLVIRKNEGIMTTQNVTIPALSGGSFSAYLAAPSSQPRAGIVLIQEVLGVNNNMRQTADVVFGYA
jgi:hypothetical protein